MKKIIAIITAIALLIGGGIAYSFYKKIYNANVSKTTSVYIPTNTNFTTITQLLSPYLNDVNSFIWVAEKKNYPNKIRAGKYKITKGMTNESLVNHLRGGKPETITLSFNNQDTFEKLAGRISKQIEADSISLLKAMTDLDFIVNNKFSKNTAIAMYIPNTYEFYWNTSANQFRNKMLKEYHTFWNNSRISKAKKQNLTPIEAITLASIVQKETATVSERPIVAGLYLNRYHDNWPLQADPTVIFSIKQQKGQDYIIKRVLNADLKTESPYNTYIHTGLPPGPISMPDISSIEAVLNPAKHKYYYMCASIRKIGEHEFAKTLSQHNKNAKKYQQWISKQGINR